ncbi:MAG: type II secretion system protein, partial [Candidatus Omnitrophota bacterium]
EPSRFYPVNSLYMHKAFTLIELIIVITVIGILVAFAAPQFGVTRERTLDREARAAIALIQAAEKVYRMEEGPYYPWPSGSTTSIANINTNLRLSLPAGATHWKYTVDSTSNQVTAQRQGGKRTLKLKFNEDSITCTPGAGDPCVGFPAPI